MSDKTFAQVMNAYLGMREVLLRFLTARLGDAAAADDIYQELFVRLKSGALPTDIANPRGYIFRTAYNLANEYVRTRRRQGARDIAWTDATTQKVGPDAVADTAAADDAVAAKERLDQVMAALGSLPDKAREVFTLRRVQELSHREIAHRLGISTKTVEKHMTTALKHLTLKLGGFLPDAEGERGGPQHLELRDKDKGAR